MIVMLGFCSYDYNILIKIEFSLMVVFEEYVNLFKNKCNLVNKIKLFIFKEVIVVK